MTTSILSYTTKVAADRTISEINALLVKKGATSIHIQYENQKPVALTFVILVDKVPVPFQLKPNLAGVKRKLPSSADMARAERVGWRIVLRWVEAQLAMVEMNLAEMAQVFLPYALDKTSTTVWETFRSRTIRELGSGS